MMPKLKLVRIDSVYCDYLRQFDNKIMYNNDRKEMRPFIGILFTINNCEYFAPLSSPKPKHLKMKNTLDFYKIDGGKLGAINFNNMIPVKRNNYKIIYLHKEYECVSDKKYYELLKDQLRWLNKRYIQVINKSFKLYCLYNGGRLNKNIMNRCCNFKLLEEKCNMYSDEKVCV